MERESRALVAYLAGCRAEGRSPSQIYDCLEKEHFNSRALLDRITPYEKFSPVDPDTLADTAEEHLSFCTGEDYIYLNMNGKAFKGYDTASSTFFAGRVRGNLVVLYINKFKEFYKYRFCEKDRYDWACGAACHNCGVEKV